MFITFEDDTDKQMAVHILKQTNIQIFGKKVEVQRAAEPSQYIWENMAYNQRVQKRNFWLVMIPFLAVIMFAYKLQFQMQSSIQYFDNYE